ncbi:glycosyltransferase family 2 protein [Alcaligenes faecalis]|uniref:glycosyltransferase family 2 protein n=1 Tax=Alcaligenes faecalis TaxID=511 RepID=UPI001C9A7ED8|nr:glycosyltransferase family 2 protein [Alcaligenes faecalis]MBY6309524.1 glycosyltransferase family 2 protein [Alcaligenes faecalis]MBY6318321.1 glycosyltransferase family 2 protein [Alcaligenes faecalis]MBY6392403.1 glycosyltransferase family 2 protein [Alcaligenes faecalis]
MLTVLTPTYNRCHTLPRLFKSLCDQRHFDFEWLIVDDGSTDDTEQWLESCQLLNLPFPVRSIAQANGGKHAALNAGVQAAQGDWVFIVDSDDLLTKDAVGAVVNALSTALTLSQDVVGVCFRKIDLAGRPIGVPFMKKEEPVLGTPTAMGRMVGGDLAYVFRRKTMAEFPFPIIPGEKFVPELYVWNLIGDQGSIWFHLDRAVYMCEYLPDGYTQNFSKQLKRHPGGFLLFYAAQIGREDRWVNKLKAIIRCMQCIVYCATKVTTRGKGS